MVNPRPLGQECPSCRLIAPAMSRRCICGRKLDVRIWGEEQQTARIARVARRGDFLLASGATILFGGVLWLAYTFTA